MTQALPFAGGNIKGSFGVPGRAEEEFNTVFDVSPRYFEVLGIPLVGRPGRRRRPTRDAASSSSTNPLHGASGRFRARSASASSRPPARLEHARRARSRRRRARRAQHRSAASGADQSSAVLGPLGAVHPDSREDPGGLRPDCGGRSPNRPAGPHARRAVVRDGGFGSAGLAPDGQLDARRAGARAAVNGMFGVFSFWVQNAPGRSAFASLSAPREGRRRAVLASSARHPRWSSWTVRAATLVCRRPAFAVVCSGSARSIRWRMSARRAGRCSRWLPSPPRGVAHSAR